MWDVKENSKKVLSILPVFAIALALITILSGCQVKPLTPTNIITTPSPVQTIRTVSKPKPTASATPKPSMAINPQDQYFTTKGEIYSINPDHTHWSYSSPTLSVEIQKYDDTAKVVCYYVANIRTCGNERMTPGFGGEQPPGSRELPSTIAQNYKAVYAQNGDFFADIRNPTGVVIREGKVYRDNKDADTLAVMPDGSLKVYAAGEIDAAGLQALGVQNTYSFGPILINKGTINPGLSKDRVYRDNPRSGIGMVEKGHYVAIVVEGRNPQSSKGVTLDEYAQMFADQGCVTAYNFDGGASSCMVFMGQPLNTPTTVLTTKNYRKVTDVIMFGHSNAEP